VDQIERLQKMTEEFDESLKQQFGNYSSKVEVNHGRKQLVVTCEKGERYIMGFMFEENMIKLTAIPEGEEMELGLTQLEKEYLETAVKRASQVFLNKFCQRTGWDLSGISSVFKRGPGVVIVSWDEGEIEITEGGVELIYDDE